MFRNLTPPTNATSACYGPSFSTTRDINIVYVRQDSHKPQFRAAAILRVHGVALGAAVQLLPVRSWAIESALPSSLFPLRPCIYHYSIARTLPLLM